MEAGAGSPHLLVLGGGGAAGGPPSSLPLKRPCWLLQGAGPAAKPAARLAPSLPAAARVLEPVPVRELRPIGRAALARLCTGRSLLLTLARK